MSPWSPPTPTTSAPRSPATTACRAAGRTPGWNGRWPALRGDPAFGYNDHSLLLIDVEPPGAGGATTLTVRAVSAAGADFDRLTLLRRQDRAAGAEPPAAGRPAA